MLASCPHNSVMLQKCHLLTRAGLKSWMRSVTSTKMTKLFCQIVNKQLSTDAMDRELGTLSHNGSTPGLNSSHNCLISVFLSDFFHIPDLKAVTHPRRLEVFIPPTPGLLSPVPEHYFKDIDQVMSFL